MLYRLWIRIVRKLNLIFGRKTKQVYLSSRIEQYHQIWKEIAKEIKANFRQLDKDIWQLDKDGIFVRTRLHQLPLDNDIVLRICGRKPLVHKLLKEANVEVPDFQLFNIEQFNIALTFLDKYPEGVVVKPCDGYAGLGVTTHIRNKFQLRRAIATASLYLDDFMIEKQIVGENYRVLVFRGQVLNAVKRTGQKIIGNGQSSISELLNSDQSNKDDDLEFTLASQGLTEKNIPEAGKSILVRSVGNNFNGGEELRTVYDKDVTGLLHSTIIKTVKLCADIAGSELVGVDIITTDISKPLIETGGVINELNTTPALHHHYDKTTEKFPKPALIMIKELLKK